MLGQAQEILKWKGSKALEHQMSRVNYRMILLALLALGITALGTFLSPTLSWAKKAGILAALALIPPLFWFLERSLERRTGKRAKLRVLEEEMSGLREDIRGLDAETRRISSDTALSEESRRTILQELESLRAAMEAELRNLEKQAG